MTTIVGIDPSLTSLGLAAIIDGVIVSTATVTSKGHTTDTLAQRAARQLSIVEKVMAFVDDYRPDLVIIEGPSFGSVNGHPHDRSGLWWGMVSRLLVLDYPVVEIPPSCRMKYATGKGQAKKDIVLAAAIKRYADANITGNDVADAVILCAMGSRNLGVPVEDSLPLTHLSGMDKVHWLAPACLSPIC
jgi:crossover junction endodeoxyribonuclease RuvC